MTAAVAAAWDVGCAVAGSSETDFRTTADFAIRRWDGVGRRHQRPLSADDRIEDLAKGLRDRLESDRRIVGPLMQDYRFLAARIAEALSAGS